MLRAQQCGKAEIEDELKTEGRSGHDQGGQVEIEQLVVDAMETEGKRNVITSSSQSPVNGNLVTNRKAVLGRQ